MSLEKQIQAHSDEQGGSGRQGAHQGVECIFKEKGFFVVSLDARSKSGMKSITDIVMEACKEKIERDRKRGIKTDR